MAAENPQTWHHGLVARYWAQFNDDFRPHEIPYFQRFVENGRGPALDVGCGTGRLLLPYLRAGLDVDGCDVSPDMVALCRERAEREGFAPSLSVQPMHALELPRRYRTIYVCGSFGLGSTREQDLEALRRFHAHLEPGGTLLVDIEVPYADPGHWAMWTKEGGRSELPRVPTPPESGKIAPDGYEYGLSSRCIAFDPLAQRISYAMVARMWKDGELVAEEDHRLDIGLYFVNELALMLDRAGFDVVAVHGDHVEVDATGDNEFVVLVAKR